jgi:triosephosphate isomerase (TIM)
MNGTAGETRALLDGIVRGLGHLPAQVDLLVCPPFTALAIAAEALRASGSPIELGGQDLHWEPRGAFTGEVSAAMLSDLGVRFVLVGHSERRTYFGERGETLLRKLRAALSGGLTPILCVGEQLEDREAGRTEAVLAVQLDETLQRLSADEAERVVLAYEPVWAIGTGRTASPEQAEEAHQRIREMIAGARGPDRAAKVRILYGGSVNGANATLLLGRPNVNGALVGGASLRADEFLAIARAAVDTLRG